MTLEQAIHRFVEDNINILQGAYVRALSADGPTPILGLFDVNAEYGRGLLLALSGDEAGGARLDAYIREARAKGLRPATAMPLDGAMVEALCNEFPDHAPALRAAWPRTHVAVFVSLCDERFTPPIINATVPVTRVRLGVVSDPTPAEKAQMSGEIQASIAASRPKTVEVVAERKPWWKF